MRLLSRRQVKVLATDVHVPKEPGSLTDGYEAYMPPQHRYQMSHNRMTLKTTEVDIPSLYEPENKTAAAETRLGTRIDAFSILEKEVQHLDTVYDSENHLFAKQIRIDHEKLKFILGFWEELKRLGIMRKKSAGAEPEKEA